MARTSTKRDAAPAGKSRKARCDGVETREALLAAAAAEFAEKGYDLASAREICRRAHANPALLSRYFGSKESLYRTVAKRLFGDLGAPLARQEALRRPGRAARRARVRRRRRRLVARRRARVG